MQFINLLNLSLSFDCKGDLSLENGVDYMSRHIPSEVIMKSCSTLVYVVDAQEDDYEDSLPRLVETIIMVYKVITKQA